MKNITQLTIGKLAGYCLFLTALLMINYGCKKEDRKAPAISNDIASVAKTPQLLKDLVQVNLVSDVDEYDALRIDPLLINAWGIAFSPGGTPWVGSQGGHVSTVYNKDNGSDVRPAVTIPSPAGPTGGNPSGVIFNGTTDFTLPNGNPARFIFAGLDGVISGWNSGNAAISMVNNVVIPAVYTGIALANDGGANFLYAANFAKRQIDVFDKDFMMVSKPFNDPSLPAGYSPFNIQNIDGKLYVMYAKVGPDGRDEAAPGNGYVDIYNPDGSLVKRFASRGRLNAPWGIAKAPAGFADAAETILVGNFGDGKINSYSTAGVFLGQLRTHGKPVEIEGLWGISFLPSTATVSSPEDYNRLYFAAGVDREEHGLFGYLKK